MLGHFSHYVTVFAIGRFYNGGVAVALLATIWKAGLYKGLIIIFQRNSRALFLDTVQDSLSTSTHG